MSSDKRSAPKFQRSASYEQSKLFTDPTSNVFVDRYGQFYTYPGDQLATQHDRIGAFCLIAADGMILLNCPPWAQTYAELPGGGLKVKPNGQTETVEEGARRELLEETSLELTEEEFKNACDGSISYFINLFAEDVIPKPGKSPWLRYSTSAFMLDLSGKIQDFSPKFGPDGSYAFWHQVDKLEELPVRTIDGKGIQIEGLRVGHQHIIFDYLEGAAEV